jgi:predicted DNA-binding protein (UPF0278 family)
MPKKQTTTEASENVAPFPIKALETTPLAAVYLPRELVNELEKFASGRGVEVATLVRVALSAVIRNGRYYELDTKMMFGKYTGETMETVIRIDPGYIKWCLGKIEGMCLSLDALRLLNATIVKSGAQN